MMSENKNKDKGSRWERDAVKLLNQQFPNTWKRVALSGALGTQLDLPMLKGDMIGDYDFIQPTLIGEAKVGYGGSQMTVRKEWFDKIKQAASETNSLPVVVLKFEKSRSGVSHVICLDFETWDKLLKEFDDMHSELLRLYEEREEYEQFIKAGHATRARGNPKGKP